MSNENNERDYLTLGDLRNLDLPDETPIIINCEGGPFVADRDHIEEDGICYITENGLEAIGEIYSEDLINRDEYEDYKEENPDTKLIKALIF